MTPKTAAKTIPTASPEWLEAFIANYIECALWSESVYLDDDGEEDSEDDRSFGTHGFDESDLSEDAREKIETDCENFVEAHFTLMSTLNAGQCGHDFFLTRNGHGAGFWDRGLGDVGDKLSAACNPFGNQSLYLGDDDTIEVGG